MNEKKSKSNNASQTINFVDTSKKPERPQLKMVNESFNPADYLKRQQENQNSDKKQK